MDGTQTTAKKPSGRGTMLVTSIAFGSGNRGFGAGVFARLVGDLSVYEATANGFGFGAAAFAIGLCVARFVRKGGML
ncbi:hypothetical protein ACFY1L_13775 [Streptomyces sp. NPDC001663]|uniref:hypothetical protein n=1 Tax=Streptomyces sp. NPDC001663 TaxID=3364597 RepID=UPI0036A00234